jgi:putative SOS response-associated peptidase YedK
MGEIARLRGSSAALDIDPVDAGGGGVPPEPRVWTTHHQEGAMCGRISLSVPKQEVIEAFEVDELPLDYHPRFNIAPGQPVLGITAAEDGTRRAGYFRWGLVPFWAKDPSIGNRMINARAETVTEKPAYRNAFTRHRCLVPVDGFYEWQRRGAGKVPLRFRMASGEPFALAGLWEEWGKPGVAPLRSCTVLTTACNEFVRPVHDRMPVILTREEQRRWLSPGSTTDELRALLEPYRGGDLEAYEVSTLVNSPSNDVAECLLPV